MYECFMNIQLEKIGDELKKLNSEKGTKASTIVI